MATYVSLGLTSLYGHFTWSDSGVSRSEIQDINPQSGRLVLKLGETRSYPIAPPVALLESRPGATQEAHANLRSLANRVSGGTHENFNVYLTELDYVCVFAKRIYLAKQDMAQLYEVNRLVDRPYQEPGLESLENLQGGPDSKSDIPEAQFEELEYPTLLLTSAGSFNWGHFLVDELPRLVAYVEKVRPPVLSVALLSWPHLNKNWKFDQRRSEAIQTLYPDVDIRFTFIDVRTPRYFKQLLFVTPNSVHPAVKSQELCKLLQDRYRAVGNNKKADQKLYVVRSGSRNISRLQQLRLKRYFQRLGYRAVRPELLSAREQFELFASASHVVGLYGAALTNVLFCQPGTKLLVISPIDPNGWLDPFYLDLSGQVGQDQFIYLHVRPNGENQVQDQLNLNLKQFFGFVQSSGFLG